MPVPVTDGATVAVKVSAWPKFELWLAGLTVVLLSLRTFCVSAAEVLLVDENGGLQVRSAYADRANAGRGQRENEWKAWIDKTERDPQGLPVDPTTGPKKVDDFK